MVQTQLTLNGKTIAITRPRGQAEEEAAIIRKKGGVPYYLPTIEIKAPRNSEPIKTSIDALAEGKFDYVIFMSVNGVTHLLNAAQNLKRQAELETGLTKCYIIAVGPRTAQELQARDIHVDAVPSTYTSEGVLAVLRLRSVKGKHICIPRTSAASPALTQQLGALGAFVDEVYVYESDLPADTGLAAKFLADLSAGRVDAIVFGSSLCVKNLFKMAGVWVSAENFVRELNDKVVVVAIGPVTAKTLIEAGLTVDVMPEQHLFEAAIAALTCYWQL
jgi:uroporphyrinogen-III synthase